MRIAIYTEIIPLMSSGSDTLAVSNVDFDSKQAAAQRKTWVSLALLCISHFFIDSYAAALSSLQPHLASKLGINLAQAGILAGLFVFANSVTQPAFGFLSDRWRSSLFTTLAPALSGIGIASIGLAPSYVWVVLSAAAGGLGIASFHPQASARSTAGIEQNKPFWMAVFISSGTLGMAAGPTFFAWIIDRFGFEQLWYGALPGILISALLLAYLPPAPAPTTRQVFAFAALKAVWRPLTILYFLVFLRSAVQLTFTQFLPLYLTRERAFSPAAASHTLSLYLAAGAFGGFVGGNIANRFGGRLTILISMLGSVPFLIGFFLLEGNPSLLSLILGGLVLLFTIPVNVVMGQQLVPSQAGTVSALMMGFAWGMSGFLIVPLVGRISESFGLHNTLFALTICPLLGFALALCYPKENHS